MVSDLHDPASVSNPRDPASVSNPRDPVENEYPRRSECPACRKRYPVYLSGTNEGQIVEHEVVDSQLSDDQRYACTIRYACPGSLASVSKWKRIPFP